MATRYIDQQRPSGVNITNYGNQHVICEETRSHFRQQSSWSWRGVYTVTLTAAGRRSVHFHLLHTSRFNFWESCTSTTWTDSRIRVWWYFLSVNGKYVDHSNLDVSTAARGSSWIQRYVQSQPLIVCYRRDICGHYVPVASAVQTWPRTECGRLLRGGRGEEGGTNLRKLRDSRFLQNYEYLLHSLIHTSLYS